MFSRLKDQKGSVLVVVMIVAFIALIVITTIASRYSSITVTAGQFTRMRENQRIGTELAKLVGLAYEAGQRGPCVAPNRIIMAGATPLCFGPPTPDQSCVDSIFGTPPICLDLSAPQAIGSANGSRYEFYAKAMPTESISPLKMILPIAEAQTMSVDTYRPAPPTGFNHTVDAIVCDGTGDPLICRACGAAPSNYVCYEVKHCPVENPGCTANHERVAIMIAR